MKKVLFIFLFLLGSTSLSAIWNYDRGVAAGKRGDTKTAFSLLAPLISDDPHNAAKLYDAGVAAYRVNALDQAKLYFENALNQSSATVELKEKTHYNLGNALAKLTSLQAALEQYEAALAINPENADAKHNRDVVKKMLEQQKQQEQQKQDQKDQDNKQDQQKQDNKDQQQDQDKREKNNNEQDSPDKQQQGSQKPDEQEQNDKQRDSDEQKKEEKNNKEHDRQAQQEQEKQQEQQAAREQEEKEKKRQEHDAQQEKKKSAAEQKLEPVLARILDEREQHDAQTHKRVIQAKVSKDLAGHHGQKCW